MILEMEKFTLEYKGSAMTYKTSELETEMMAVYAGLRLDGMPKENALAMLFVMEYKVTPLVLKAIREQDKYIFAFNQ